MRVSWTGAASAGCGVRRNGLCVTAALAGMPQIVVCSQRILFMNCPQHRQPLGVGVVGRMERMHVIDLYEDYMCVRMNREWRTEPLEIILCKMKMLQGETLE